MNKWILPMAFVVFGLIVGVFALADVHADVVVADEPAVGSCAVGSCAYAKQGGCTAEANCGASGCPAANGAKSCGCGK
jgi:hypothetical protein